MEESLRSEVLVSEEQRSYIEVLKQSINVKMTEQGIQQGDTDLYVEYSNLQAEYEEMRKENSTLQRNMNNLCSELDSMRNRQPTPSEEDLGEAAQALQIAQNEIAKLEDEKLTLIEYVATSKDNEDRFQSQLEEQNKQIALLSEKVNKYKNLKEELEEQFEKEKGEMEVQLEKQAGEAHLQTEESEAAQNQLQVECEELMKQIEALKVKN